MSQTALGNLGVNYDWEEGDDGWKNGMDLNLLMLDAMGQAVVVSTVNADPWVSTSNPAPGKMYIVGTAPVNGTAPWNTTATPNLAASLALATGDNCGVTRWHMVAPKDGWTVQDQATGEKMIFIGVHGSGGYWEYVYKYLIANSREIAFFDGGNDGVGPYTADRADPTSTLTRLEASSQILTLSNTSMLGSIDFTKVTPGTITGTGSFGNFTCTAVNVPEETWTLVCTTGGIANAVFSVTGSVSGVQASATANTPYDNGIIAFDLVWTTGTHWTTTTGGSADKIEFTVREQQILYATADSDIFPAMIGIHTSGMASGSNARAKITTGTAAGPAAVIWQADTFSLIQPLISYEAALNLSSPYASRVSGPVRAVAVDTKSAAYQLVSQDAGKTIIMDATAGSIALTIPDSPTVDMGENCIIRVFHKGANTVTITPDTGVTLVGATTVATDTFRTLQRDGTSDTWYCG